MNTFLKNAGNHWRKIPRTWRFLLLALAWLGLLGAPLLWHYLTPQGAALYGHNHTDRPISDYTVNGNWGGNGGVTCCWAIDGDLLEVAWIKGMTGEQFRQGIKEEQRELRISNPPRKRTDHYLHVHFFPDDQVRLAWSPDHDSPYEGLKEAPQNEETSR